uniref:PH domain-containing protein n=1 Tax=Gadus morhua TaxID=8049 RepID=A0A8C5C0K8_GADMO
MEGILYKWTNYMTGWQPRWFVLEDGTISYYDSEDDVGKGSKGSIKMSVCDIKG